MNEKVKKWLIKAIEDFKIAQHEMQLSDDETVTSAVCFHSQQFVEKVLKAYLTLKGVDFGKTHNIELLLELCAERDKDFKNLEIGNLTFYAVEVRYPEEFYIPSINEARECFHLAKKIKEFIEGKLKINFEDLR